jgi:hypothetical protein
MKTVPDEIARWNAERDAVLRSLDVERFQAFWTKYQLPMPAGGWAPAAPLIMMHKCRLQVTAMTEAEKEFSRSWLLSRGYSLEIGVGR